MSTLLGPEGSASCGWAFWSSLACASRMWGVWVLVGLLFEICIVDASIFVMRRMTRLAFGWVLV